MQRRLLVSKMCEEEIGKKCSIINHWSRNDEVMQETIHDSDTHVKDVLAAFVNRPQYCRLEFVLDLFVEAFRTNDLTQIKLF